MDVIFDIFECFPDVLNGQHISIFLLKRRLKPAATSSKTQEPCLYQLCEGGLFHLRL